MDVWMNISPKCSAASFLKYNLGLSKRPAKLFFHLWFEREIWGKQHLLVFTLLHRVHGIHALHRAPMHLRDLHDFFFETRMNKRLLSKNGLGMERDWDCSPCKWLVHLFTRINRRWVLRVHVQRPETRASTLSRLLSMSDLRNHNFPLWQREDCVRHWYSC